MRVLRRILMGHGFSEEPTKVLRKTLMERGSSEVPTKVPRKTLMERGLLGGSNKQNKTVEITANAVPHFER